MRLFKRTLNSPQSKATIDALWRLEKIILDTLDFNQVVQTVVDSVLLELGYLNLGYRIVVLALVDEEEKMLKRISISQTPEAMKALQVTPVPFKAINIPFSETSNYCIRAVTENKQFVTHDWNDILAPLYTPDEARRVQQVVGIKTSMVYPVISRGKPIGVIIFSMDKGEEAVSPEEADLIRGFTDVVGLGVQNAQLFSSLEARTAELDAANRKLEQLDHLKDDFVSVASHELRTPMTAIKSYLWMALNKKRQELSPDVLKYLDRAYLATDRLINLVSDMLNVSRIEGGRVALRLAEVDLIALAKEVIEEVLPKANEKKLNIVVEDTTLPKVLCDRDKIHEVYLNLIGNSMKFTPQGGTITISNKQDGDFVRVTVADSGHGIAAEDLQRLFTKFGRLDNSYVSMAESGGTGLGLYISKSIVHLHSGAITATSEGLGKGAQFSFTIPVVGTVVATKLMRGAPKEDADTKELEKTNVQAEVQAII